MRRSLTMLSLTATIGLMFCAGGAAGQSAAQKQTVVTGFTRDQVMKYKVTGSGPYVLERDGSYDAKGSRAGINWPVTESLKDGRVVVKMPDGGLVGFDGTQVKTNAAADLKGCSAVPSLGVKSRNLSSQGLNECPQ